MGRDRPPAARMGPRQPPGARRGLLPQPAHAQRLRRARDHRGVLLLPAGRDLHGGPALRPVPDGPRHRTVGDAGLPRSGAGLPLRHRPAAGRRRNGALGRVPARHRAVRRLLAHQLPARPAAGRHGDAGVVLARARGRFLHATLGAGVRRLGRPRHADQAALRGLRGGALGVEPVARPALRRASTPARAGGRFSGRRRRAVPALVRAATLRPAHADPQPLLQTGGRTAEPRAADGDGAPLLPADPANPARAPGRAPPPLGALGAQEEPGGASRPLARHPRAFRRVLADPEQKPPATPCRFFPRPLS